MALRSGQIHEEWQFGILGCFEDLTLFFDVICCAPCNVARQYDALEGRENSMNPFMCIATCIPNPLLLVASMYVRLLVTERFGIRENCAVTACAPLLCFPCSLSQTYRELNGRGLWPGGTLCVPEPYTTGAYYPGAEAMQPRGYGTTA